MATAPANNLPLFYKDLVPLSSIDHADYHARSLDTAEFLVGQHAIPLTSDEFVSASRYFPIVFSSGENPVPLALMGLNEGVNIFVDDQGKLINPVYVPAYVRRYPFMLARLNPDSDDLSLCFDPTSPAIGKFEEGDALFADGQPTEPVNSVLEFCRTFEEAGQRTSMFVEELKKADLLMDGEVAIQPEGNDKPFIYRGFQMVDENKLRELRGDVLRKMMQNGILALIFAHLFSLQLMREIFAEQVRSGKVPELIQVPAV
ncbi:MULTISPECIES: SapC family protein [unclassified Sphingopyxis]|uniref:SapC family protein n=1 Tax=unclassified Sphingopyxis TaxID=2614943 RepID=UPI0024AE6A4C|nr:MULTISPECIES: SapC family protein [unclassified Sphingopyxis]